MVSYADRLSSYEQQKRRLQTAGLTPTEYERQIRELAKKYRI